MRPSVEIPGKNIHECTDCGERVTDPDSRRCDCGGTLENVSRSRDL